MGGKRGWRCRHGGPWTAGISTQSWAPTSSHSQVISSVPTWRGLPRGLRVSRTVLPGKVPACTLLLRRVQAHTPDAKEQGTGVLYAFCLLLKAAFWFLPQYSEKEDKYEEEIKLLSDKLKEVSHLTQLVTFLPGLAVRQSQ